MEKDEQRLEAEVRDLLARALDQDRADDGRLGTGVPETDLPAELLRREDRLARIRAAKTALEADARETRAAQLREQAERARELAASSDDPVEQGRASRRAERRDAAARALDRDDGADGASGSKPGDGPTGPTAGRVEAEVVGTPELPVHHTKATRAGLPQPSAQRNFTDPESPPGRAVSWSGVGSSPRHTTATSPLTTNGT